MSDIAEDFLQMRVGALKYRLSPAADIISDINGDVEEIREAKRLIETFIDDETMRSQLAGLAIDIEAYEQAFLAMAGASNLDMEVELAAKLDQIGPSTAGALDEIQNGLLAQQDELGPRASETVRQVRSTLPIILVATVAVTFVASLILSRSVTAPLQRLTETMTKMASGGDTHVDITDQDRGDEVGEMARALEAFRQALVQNERLVAQRHAEAEQRRRDEEEQQRADAIKAEESRRQEDELKRNAAEDADRLRSELASTFEAEVGVIIGEVAAAIARVSDATTAMTELAEASRESAGAAETGAVQTTENVNEVASATEQLTASW
ncbi:MAG: HAMP domain-containing protein [Pseudomonadota bacterium]